MSAMDRIVVATGRDGWRNRGELLAPIRYLRSALRSMLGQMVLATALFVGCGIYVFALAPILAMPPLDPPDPMETTLAALSERFQDAMLQSGAGAAQLREALRDPMVRDIRRLNPRFRYYLAHGNAVVANAPPRYWRTMGLARFDSARQALSNPSLCAQLSRPIRDDHGGGYVVYGNCGKLKYVEFDGVHTPIVVPVPRGFQVYLHWLWSYSRNFLLPSLGVFAVLATILIVNVLRIRRVARLTRSLGTDRPTRMLPETGLPSEVTPLVKAMNGMIARAEETQRRRRFFLSAAAHEMRTPLTILRTRMESLDDGNVKTRLIHDLSRLTTLSNDLLTLTGIEGRQRSFAPVDLTSSCLEVIGDLDEMAIARDVSFRFRQPDRSPIVLGDAALLKSAITNLVDNALSFAPQGSTVVVALDDDGSLAVRDFGAGIRLIDADTLFEPFVRAPGKRPGHGLGLAIVRAVAELHGATASAANAPGGGACFTIRFPPVSLASA